MIERKKVLTHNSVEDINIYYKVFTTFLLNLKIPLSSIIFLFVDNFQEYYQEIQMYKERTSNLENIPLKKQNAINWLGCWF